MAGEKDYSVQNTLKDLATQYKKIQLTGDSTQIQDKVKQRKQILIAMFNSLNREGAQEGASAVINFEDVSDLDDAFKKIMGLQVSGKSYTQKQFEDNIGNWVDGFAKWKKPTDPKPPEKPKTPIPKAHRATIANLSGQLVKAIQPDMGNNWLCDMLAFDDDDDARATRTFALFGDNATTQINEYNIIEVLDQIDLKEFRYSAHFFDDQDETRMVKLVKGLIRDRVAILEKNKAITPEDAKTVRDTLNDLKDTDGKDKEASDFSTAINACINTLRDVGVAEE